MKQLKNGFMPYYYLTEKGELYNSDTNTYAEANKEHRFRIKKEDNTTVRITLKTLYKLVYNTNFCIDNIENLTDEQWQPIQRTDDRYFISNKGRVKSLVGYEAKILKPTITAKGYERLDITLDGSRSTKFVHRLVADAFFNIPAYSDMQLHHKDTNKQNNTSDNLVWLTPKQHREAHKQLNKEKKGDKK